MACVRKRRGKWTLDYTDQHGHRRREAVDGNKKDAQRLLAKRLQEIGRGTLAMPRITKAVAFHEAAHAVIRVAVGLGPTTTEVRPDGSGISHGLGAITSKNQFEVWDLVAVGLAGTFAEARVTKQSVGSIVLSGGMHDWQDQGDRIRWLVATGYAADEHAAWRRAEEEATQRVNEHWPSIEKLAKHLLRNPRIEAHELRQLLDSGRGATT